MRTLPDARPSAGPGPVDRERWRTADRHARPRRLARLRERLQSAGLDAYFGVRAENGRYLTGFALRDGEEKVAGQSGHFFVDGEGVVVLADSRYTIQAEEECPEARIEAVYRDLEERWPSLVDSLRPVPASGHARGVRRLAAEAGLISQAAWRRLEAAAPHVELVPVEGWVEELRAVKEPAEVERIGASCAIADAALAALLPEIRPGRTERDLALELEWAMRTGGADGISFDVTCLAGPRAALPHGAPSDRQVSAGAVLLFDFGAQVDGYRSDMTRTLFVGEPAPRDRSLYELVHRAQSEALEALSAAAAGGERPGNRAVDAVARRVIEEAGHGEAFGHGLGHGIGLATHEAPSIGRKAAEERLPSPTVFSVEPGVYLAGETGVRIEDLVLFDAPARRFERLTHFPRELTTVG